MLKINKQIAFLSLLIITLLISCSENENPFSPGLEVNVKEQLEADVAHGALKSNGTLWTWGRNWNGQCGNGTLDSDPIPKKIKDDIVAFKFRDGSAVAADIHGNIWYWGDKMIYSPPSEIDATIETPVIISELTDVVSIEMRASTIELLRKNGTVWRLDWNPYEPTVYIDPEKIEGLENITAISGHLALKNDGSICLLDDSWIEPNRGGYISDIQDVEALQNRWKTHTIILKTDGTVWAWGKNISGTLGDGTSNDSSVPVQVKNLIDIIAISANGAHCLALKNDGTVWFWGSGIYAPQMVSDLTDVVLIYAAGAFEHLVKKNDDSYWMFTFDGLVPYQVLFGN